MANHFKAHVGNGRNYTITFFTKKVVVGTYYTNGHSNGMLEEKTLKREGLDLSCCVEACKLEEAGRVVSSNLLRNCHIELEKIWCS